MGDLNKEITGDPIKEARRYVDNARDVQRKKTCEDGFRLANEIIDQCERLLGEQSR